MAAGNVGNVGFDPHRSAAFGVAAHTTLLETCSGPRRQLSSGWCNPCGTTLKLNPKPLNPSTLNPKPCLGYRVYRDFANPKP